jgi:hypothetical protein
MIRALGGNQMDASFRHLVRPPEDEHADEHK